MSIEICDFYCIRHDFLNEGFLCRRLGDLSSDCGLRGFTRCFSPPSLMQTSFSALISAKKGRAARRAIARQWRSRFWGRGIFNSKSSAANDAFFYEWLLIATSNTKLCISSCFFYCSHLTLRLTFFHVQINELIYSSISTDLRANYAFLQKLSSTERSNYE